MKNINKIINKSKTLLSVVSIAAMTLSAVFIIGSVQAKQASSLDQLLLQLEQGQIAQSKQNNAREAEFIAKKSEQTALLTQAQISRSNATKLSASLEADYQLNELALANKTEALTKRMGELKELFGVLQQVSGDTKSKFQTSVVSAQIPGREVFLNELAKSMGSTSKLASISQIERLWFELQREMTESGKVVNFDREIVLANGETAVASVTRVGNFNLVANGNYLEYINETGRVANPTQ